MRGFWLCFYRTFSSHSNATSNRSSPQCLLTIRNRAAFCAAATDADKLPSNVENLSRASKASHSASASAVGMTLTVEMRLGMGYISTRMRNCK